MNYNNTQANGTGNASFKLFSTNKEGESILKKHWLEAHKKSFLHIHDLEYTGISYNCIGINLKEYFEKKFCNVKEGVDITDVLDEILEVVVNLSNEQSGGIGILNIDDDLAPYVKEITQEELTLHFRKLFKRLNLNLRKGYEKAYITFNMGLNLGEEGKKITRAMLEAFEKGEPLTGKPFLFPNLVFKVKSGINREKGSPNHDLLCYAAKVTGQRMNPTYFNCDVLEKLEIPGDLQGIMGCRTLMGMNQFGESGGIGRGNLAALSLNLPKIAVESEDYDEFFAKLDNLCEMAREILIERYKLLCTLPIENFQYILENKFYLNSDSEDLEKIFKNGTLSLGFMGIFDAISKLRKLSIDTQFIRNHIEEAEEILKFMRKKTDFWSEKYKMNFSLLASSGEGISGKFAKEDPKNDFYTNSFHVPVYCNISIFEKIKIEASLSNYCNGGSISYVEFPAQISGNIQGVLDTIEYGIAKGCVYMGINFKLDICNECGDEGSFQETSCPSCGSGDIQRIRRVSGYLSTKDTLRAGKKEEEMARLSNYK